MQYRTLLMILSEVKGFYMHTTSMTSYFFINLKILIFSCYRPTDYTNYLYISHKNE